ncbi:hypothetical protein AAG570_010726 [Ranatra chinensis]|uniref:glucose-6-phosphatase n=1 Tax=Ranatra chinensis TaxID=642074 RepID=A0ABD0YND7_9HEMI
MTKISDPSYAISILFPVFASLDTSLGSKILLVSAVTEWFNTFLKWTLMEDRPYWWVREANIVVPLRQTDVTCETGPGSPSGHVMGASAFLYVFITWIRSYIASDRFQYKYHGRKKNVEYFMWIVFSILIILVSLSRMIIAAHFLHQCVLGCILGVAVSKFLTDDNSNWSIATRLNSYAKYKMLAMAVLFTGLSALFYWTHIFFGMDPGWSIKLAFKWCQRPETISVYTTPIYSLVRDCGCFFGLALAWPLKIRQFYPLVGSVAATLFFVCTRLLKPLMPTNDVVQFYTFHFIEHFFITLCLLTIIPYIASLVKVKEKKN